MKINLINRDGLEELEGEKGEVLFKNLDSIPEGNNIKIFQGIFSQNYKVGEKNRNGYKYDQEGWFVDNYKRLPIVLWQHDDSYGGIGFTDELYIDSNNNLSGIFYVDLDMLEERHKKQVNKGFVKSISTGAITMESMFEHSETGKRYTEEEAIDEFGWSNVIESLCGLAESSLIYVITKAELIENSLVTLGSNFGAIAKSVNSIGDEMKTIANLMKSKQDKNILISKDSIMNLEEAKKKINSLNTKAETLENEVSKKDTKIETLENEVSKKDTKIETLENEMKELKVNIKESDNKIQKLEDAEKETILANANIDNTDSGNSGTEGTEETDEVKTKEDFFKKYSN